MKRLSRILREERGSDMIEYALLSGVICCIGISCYPIIGPPIARIFRKLIQIMRRV